MLKYFSPAQPQAKKNTALYSLFLRPPLRHVAVLHSTFVPVYRYIELAVAAPILFDVRVSIHTWTDDVSVLFFHSPCQTAGAGSITVTNLVCKETLQDVHHKGFIFVQTNTLRLCILR